MDYLPDSHGNQSDEKKFCPFFFVCKYQKFLVKTLHLEYSNLIIVPGRDVYKE